MQGYDPEAELDEDYLCEVAEVDIVRSEGSIVLPAGSDIDSPKYPLHSDADLTATLAGG